MLGSAIHTVDRRGTTVTTILGAVDCLTSGAISEAIDAGPERPEVVDCRLVSLLDASGVSMLLRLHERRPVTVIPSTPVERVLAVCGLDELMTSERPDLALDDAPFGVATFDSDLRFTYVNAAMASINGMAPAHHLGHRPSELFEIDGDGVTPQLEAALRRRLVSDELVSATINGADATYRFCAYAIGHDSALRVVSIVEPVHAAEARDAALRLHFRTLTRA